MLNSWWLSQSKYRKAGGATAAAQQQDAAADLFTLRLDQPFALQLLRAHPQPALRRAVYQAAVMPRVRATLQAAGMLVGIRQHIAQALGAPSYAHLQLASSSPGACACCCSALFLSINAAAVADVADPALVQLD